MIVLVKKVNIPGNVYEDKKAYNTDIARFNDSWFDYLNFTELQLNFQRKGNENSVFSLYTVGK